MYVRVQTYFIGNIASRFPRVEYPLFNVSKSMTSHVIFVTRDEFPIVVVRYNYTMFICINMYVITNFVHLRQCTEEFLNTYISEHGQICYYL